jgi:uncharacterized protein YbjT (DUF2867 family)
VSGPSHRAQRAKKSSEEIVVKVVVIGGTGLIGSKLVEKLSGDGHQAVAASPRTGVNALTGEGLSDALRGASVVVDVSNSPSFEDEAVMDFFRTSTTHLLEAEAHAAVTHHVVLSVVGTERLRGNAYIRAKQTQEELVRSSGMPFSVVHATQFFEFMKAMADDATEGGTVRLAPVRIQPMAAGDVAAALARVAAGPPANGLVEVAGPEAFQLDQLIRDMLASAHDPRDVVADAHAGYYGAQLQERTLLPGPDARTGGTRFSDWLAHQS